MEKHDDQMPSPADINSFNAADTPEEFEQKLGKFCNNRRYKGWYHKSSN